jgi:hypothetical protein
MAASLMRRSVKRKAGFDIAAVAPLDVVASSVIPAVFGHATGDSFIRISHSGAARPPAWPGLGGRSTPPAGARKGGARRAPAAVDPRLQRSAGVELPELGLLLGVHAPAPPPPQPPEKRVAAYGGSYTAGRLTPGPPAPPHPRPAEKLVAAYGGAYKNLVRFEGDHNHLRPRFFYDSVTMFFHQQASGLAG